MSVFEDPGPGTSSGESLDSSKGLSSGERPRVDSQAASRESKEPPEQALPSGLTFAESQKPSLLEWLGVIEHERLDAVVIARKDDGTKGCLWCVSGEIIDARSGTLSGEQAAARILTALPGTFSVAFGAVDRLRTITKTSGAMLLDSMRSKTQHAGAAEHRERQLAGTSTPPVVLGPTSDLLDEPPPDESSIPKIFPRVRIPRRVQHIAAVFALAAVAFASWQLAAPSSQEGADGSRAGTRAAGGQLTSSNLLINVDVEPTYAQIWLDGEHVGSGHLSQLLVRDHRAHDIRFFAPGYVAQSIIFREASPPRRIALEQIDRIPHDPNPPPIDEPAPVRVDDLVEAVDPPETSPEKRQAARVDRARPKRSNVSPPAVMDRKHALAAKEMLPVIRVDPPMPRTPKVQVIDDWTRPRVQVIDERDPTRPKVQIIDGRLPQVQVLE